MAAKRISIAHSNKDKGERKALRTLLDFTAGLALGWTSTGERRKDSRPAEDVSAEGMSPAGEPGNSGGCLDNRGLLLKRWECARCGSQFDKKSMRLDGEYDMVCDVCYLLTEPSATGFTAGNSPIPAKSEARETATKSFVA